MIMTKQPGIHRDSETLANLLMKKCKLSKSGQKHAEQKSKGQMKAWFNEGGDVLTSWESPEILRNSALGLDSGAWLLEERPLVESCFSDS